MARGADGHAGDGGESLAPPANNHRSSAIDVLRNWLESWLAHSGNFNRHAAYTATCRSSLAPSGTLSSASRNMCATMGLRLSGKMASSGFVCVIHLRLFAANATLSQS